jgi:hypothetical protein
MDYTYARANRINIDLFQKVKEAILEEPQRLGMGDWIAGPSSFYHVKQKPRCGTVACIAGWAAIVAHRERYQASIPLAAEKAKFRPWENAIRELNLPPGDDNKLFYHSSWPHPFLEQYDGHNEGTAANAAVVCARIDHYLETGK